MLKADITYIYSDPLHGSDLSKLSDQIKMQEKLWIAPNANYIIVLNHNDHTSIKIVLNLEDKLFRQIKVCFIYLKANDENLTPEFESFCRKCKEYGTNLFFIPDYLPQETRLYSLEKGLLEAEGQIRSEELLKRTLDDFERIKKIYGATVPIRHEKIKGLNFFTKYAAGKSKGGDFFDIIHTNKESLFFMTTAKSYLATSLVLSHMQALRELKTPSVEDFLEELYSDLQNKGVCPKENNIEVLCFTLDASNLVCEGHVYGDFTFFVNENVRGNQLYFNPLFSEKAFFKFTLKRDSMFAVFSSGLKANDTSGELFKMFSGFFEKAKEKAPKSFIEECFYQLDSVNKGDFLVADTSLLLIEVPTHVVHKV